MEGGGGINEDGEASRTVQHPEGRWANKTTQKLQRQAAFEASRDGLKRWPPLKTKLLTCK